MKPIFLYLAIVKIAIGEKLYQTIFGAIRLREEDLKPQPSRRIFGGRTAAEGQFPFMILVFTQPVNDIHSLCSGSLIHTNWVLISAHCIHNKNIPVNNIVLAGGKAGLTDYLKERINSPISKIIPQWTYGVQERRAKNYFIHPQISPTLAHDIAIIRLNVPFTSNKINRIKLANIDLTAPKRCTVVGWGLNYGNRSDGKLKYIKDKIVNTTKLGCLYKKEGPFLCITPIGGGICQGDSGSPVICDDRVFGIASHLVGLVPTPSCGTSVEEYYSHTFYDINWLDKMVHKSEAANMFSLKKNLRLIAVVLFVLYLCEAKFISL